MDVGERCIEMKVADLYKGSGFIEVWALKKRYRVTPDGDVVPRNGHVPKVLWANAMQLEKTHEKQVSGIDASVPGIALPRVSGQVYRLPNGHTYIYLNGEVKPLSYRNEAHPIPGKEGVDLLMLCPVCGKGVTHSTESGMWCDDECGKEQADKFDAALKEGLEKMEADGAFDDPAKMMRGMADIFDKGLK